MIWKKISKPSPLGQSAIIRWAVDRYLTRLTPAGRVFLYGMVISLMLGASSMDVPIYIVWCGAMSVLMVATLMSLVFTPPDIQTKRRLPKHVKAGEKITYNVSLANNTGKNGRYLEVGESVLPPELKAFTPESNGSAISLLPPKARHELTLGLECSKRGVYKLNPLALYSAFPTGLVKARRRTGPEEQLIVYPYFKRLTDFHLPAGRRYQPGGLAMTSNVGDSTEFLCTREYRYGDSIRDIHWASWARTGKPVVKVFQEEYFVRLAMLLDSEVKGNDDRAFEAGISLAASVADVLSRQEYIIDIFAAGEKIFRFQAGRALAHFDNILEILACITHTPSVDIGNVTNTISPEAGNLSALICIMMDWDEKRRSMIRHLRSLGLATKTIIVRETETSIPIDGEPGVESWRPDEVLEAFS